MINIIIGQRRQGLTKQTYEKMYQGKSFFSTIFDASIDYLSDRISSEKESRTQDIECEVVETKPLNPPIDGREKAQLLKLHR